MRRLVLLAAGLALAAGMLEGAEGAAPQEKRVPDLIGLKRSEAEARLAQEGFRYLLPTPRAVRFEAVTPHSGRTEEAVPEAKAPDREVVAQYPTPGDLASPGEVIDFGTLLPPDPGGGERWVFPEFVYRSKVWPDGRQLTLHYRALARRCQALDHVNVGFAKRYVVAFPSLTDTFRSEQRCSNVSKRVAHLELPQPVGQRIVIDRLPARPRRGLYEVAPAGYGRVIRSPRASAVAVEFGHSSDCGLLARVKVRETRHTVRITLFEGNLGRSKYCLANLITELAVVPLRKPLGDRRIIDGGRRR